MRRCAWLALLAGACAPSGDPKAHPPGIYPGDPLPAHTAYLTFDDGPSPWTAAILDVLAEKNVPATFFVNAFNLKGPAGLDGTYDDASGAAVAYRDVLRRTVESGHALGNHTLHHLDLETLDAAQIDAELDGNVASINDALARAGAAPYPIRLLRPPFGSPWLSAAAPPDKPALEARVGAELAPRGENVLWNLDSTDSREWADGEWYVAQDADPAHLYDPSRAAYQQKVMRLYDAVTLSKLVTSGDGVVILLHDTHPTTRDALAAVIDALRSQGYRFAAVEEARP
jgi:peptidoglycan/xylan/chitin deacetylase (PgdA/CDA1 family)